jgi:hypothetical protein
VREGERAKHVSKQRAVVKTLVARTLKGDARAATLLLSTMTRWLDAEEAPKPSEVVAETQVSSIDEIAERLSALAEVTGWRLVREGEPAESAAPEPSPESGGATTRSACSPASGAEPAR